MNNLNHKLDQLIDDIVLLVDDHESSHIGKLDRMRVTDVIKDHLGEVFEKAALHDAMMNQNRIRILGYAGLGNCNYQHIGMEWWTSHLNSDDPRIVNESENNRQILLKYLRTHAKKLGYID